MEILFHITHDSTIRWTMLFKHSKLEKVIDDYGKSIDYNISHIIYRMIIKHIITLDVFTTSTRVQETMILSVLLLK